MTRFSRVAFGVLVVLAAGGAVCNGNADKTPPPVPTTVQIDTQATIVFADGKITVTPMIAFIGVTKPFSWQVTLPENHKLEIDFRVSGGRKGPFAKPSNGLTGRYLADASGKIDAGTVEHRRSVHKYDVIVRDAKGNDVAAIDPMIVDVE